MKLRTTQDLYGYWNSLRGDADAPYRDQVQPAAMRAYLPEVFLLARYSPRQYPFRIAGTGLCSYFGSELRDIDFLDMWNADEREGLESLLLSVTDDCAGAVLGICAETEDGRKADLEAILLPLRLGQDHCSQVIGTMSPFRNEFWLGHRPIVRQSIQSLRLLWPAAATARQSVAGLHAEPIPIVRDSAPERRQRPRLVVIDGGRV